MKKIFSFEPYQDITGCFTINILPSFAESRQIEARSWRIVCTPSDSCKRGAETTVCSLRFAQRQGASKRRFLAAFSPLKSGGVRRRRYAAKGLKASAFKNESSGGDTPEMGLLLTSQK